MGSLLANPLVVLGAILVLGALLGDISERLKIPWITGCIVAGVILGPAAAQIVQKPQLSALGGFTQAALAIIAFNIGSKLAFQRMQAIGRSVTLLALAQLLAAFLFVLGAEAMTGLAFGAAVIVAAIAPATAPTTTYAVIERRGASGPFVDRVLGALAINDALTVLFFSLVSSAALAMLAAEGSAQAIGASLLSAVASEGLSIAEGVAAGAAYLAARRFIADGTPGCESRLTAMLLGLLALSIGIAITFELSHLLAPLSFGVVVANGSGGAQPEHAHDFIQPFEEPLFIVFFVLAGAHLPLSAVEELSLLTSAIVYLAGRFAGKYASVFLVASALRLDRPTRRYLGLCFPSQGALAMGLILAFRHSPAVERLPAASAEPFDAAVSIILVSVLLSQLAGPLLIDFAIRRGSEPRLSSSAETAQRS